MFTVTFNVVKLIIILLILFIIVTKIFKNISYFQERKKAKYFFSGLTAIFFYALFSLVFFNFLTKIPQEKFNEVLWKENVSERHKMIDDLLESDYLIGKQKDTIESIFGKPLKIDTEKSTMEYELISRSWADFNVIIIKLYLQNDIITRFEYLEQR